MAKSIISNQRICYLCGSTQWMERHHIFGGAFRQKSEHYGLWVYLCHYCHNEPPNGVHHNRERMDYLRRIGQHAFEKAYPDKPFAAEFGRNYTGGESDDTNSVARQQQTMASTFPFDD
ncbi:MAG: hypothetical protein II896_03925 [Clostridia bacterium]|nr:hypothetical protein [Clostridia bacterium]